MNLRLLVSGCFSLVTFLVSAAPEKMDLLTVGSITYTNVTVLGQNDTDLYFTHKGGIGNVKLKYLSPDLQKRFNYDPRAGAEAERKQREQDAQYQSSVAAAVTAEAQRSLASKTSTTLPSLADPISDQSLLGKHAPAVSAEKWVGDKPSLEGKSLMLIFWAPSSSACRKWIPDWNAFKKKFGDRLALVGVTSESEQGILDLAEVKVEFASALDPKGRLSAAAGVTSIPSILLVDPAGTVRYQGHPAALTEAYLQGWLQKPAER